MSHKGLQEVKNRSKESSTWYVDTILENDRQLFWIEIGKVMKRMTFELVIEIRTLMDIEWVKIVPYF